MKIIDNISVLLQDDLKANIQSKDKVSVAAACFSIYAYQALKKELDNTAEFCFLFTSPTFNKEKQDKEQREFYIPKAKRESSLYGTDFEIKLRNELTQKAIAQECAKWIKTKATFKTNTTNSSIQGMIGIQSDNKEIAYNPIQEFTTVGLGLEKGNSFLNPIIQTEDQVAKQLLDGFESVWNNNEMLQDVTDMGIDSISTVYKENSPESIYFMALYNIFHEFLSDISEDTFPNEATGYKQSKVWNLLYDFQKDAAIAIINKLEKYNGCILADSVGLGKTFTALSVIKYYENRNKSVLVLCPKKLSENWNTYKGNYKNNPLADDRLRYDVLFHTDLSRERGYSNGLNLANLNWGNYDLVVIDESHNFRNGNSTATEDGKENRYQRLMNRIIRAGVKTKVLMLSATPVNNKFNDLKNQLALAYEGDAALIDDKLGTRKSIDEIFRQAQTAFNAWSNLPAEKRTTEALLKTLDFDFFEVLDSVTIARSRKHIEKYYDTAKIGKFPNRLKPITERSDLTDLPSAITFEDINDILNELYLSIYTPFDFIQDSKLYKYEEYDNRKEKGLSISGRQRGQMKLMRVNLLKRLESSVHSFRLTLQRVKKQIDSTIEMINQFEKSGKGLFTQEFGDFSDLDLDDENSVLFTVGNKVKIDLADMDWKSWKEELEADAENLKLLESMIEDITYRHDTKLQELKQLLDHKINYPINPGNKKVIIFTAFADTADYLYEHVSKYMLEKYGLHTAIVTGTKEGRSTIKNKKFHPDLNEILTCFSPISKGKDMLLPDVKENIDILIATDCISEGQNLQDCDYLINYDIHWNPVRIIQQFGRIDRIGSKNEKIQLVNFWPNMDLDKYINLKARVETRMKATILTATGDDNLISPEEKGDLEYRKQQLKKLQSEVVDIEDMSDGISVMDLGLNDFRMDLIDYSKTHKDIDKLPHGLHTIVPADKDDPEGIIFVLKNINEEVNVDHQNRIHPFYMVYVGIDGEIVCDYLNPKTMLDTIRKLSKGKTEPIKELCSRFNKETRDGKDMSEASELLDLAISSIINSKEESDLDSLFTLGGTTALMSDISGLEDFELICFFVVKKGTKTCRDFQNQQN